MAHLLRGLERIVAEVGLTSVVEVALEDTPEGDVDVVDQLDRVTRLLLATACTRQLVEPNVGAALVRLSQDFDFPDRIVFAPEGAEGSRVVAPREEGAPADQVIDAECSDLNDSQALMELQSALGDVRAVVNLPGPPASAEGDPAQLIAWARGVRS